MPDLDTITRLAPPVEPLDAPARARIHSRLGGTRRIHRRVRLLVAPALAMAALPIVVFALATRGSDRAWAAEALRVAEAAPRLLVSGDGWRVAGADEWTAQDGEMTFRSGSTELLLRWTPASELQTEQQNMEFKGTRQTMQAKIPGGATPVYRFNGTDSYAAVWRDGDSVVVARARANDPQQFAALLTQLHHVSVDDWLTAMPPDIIQPATAHTATVDQMLTGLPLPPGFDVAALQTNTQVRDRYQLGTQVAGAVACGWLAEWTRATKNGDRAAVTAARDALATSHNWPVLLDMQTKGYYPEVLWQYADATAEGHSLPAEKGGIATYPDALGCTG